MAFGFTSSDAESEHALILSENGIELSRSKLEGSVREYCLECGDKIDERRVAFLKSKNMRCEYCIPCQQQFDKRKSNIKMLDRIL